MPGTQFFFPQGLFDHAQAEVAEGAGAPVERADLAPLRGEALAGSDQPSGLGAGRRALRSQRVPCFRPTSETSRDPGVRGLPLPKNPTSTAGGEGFWELQSTNIWGLKVGEPLSQTLP